MMVDGWYGRIKNIIISPSHLNSLQRCQTIDDIHPWDVVLQLVWDQRWWVMRQMMISDFFLLWYEIYVIISLISHNLTISSSTNHYSIFWSFLLFLPFFSSFLNVVWLREFRPMRWDGRWWDGRLWDGKMVDGNLRWVDLTSVKFPINNLF